MNRAFIASIAEWGLTVLCMAALGVAIFCLIPSVVFWAIGVFLGAIVAGVVVGWIGRCSWDELTDDFNTQ
jgi:hypothetical protein